jgi:nucleotidyltransferase/DNA polymerase involved in DNA repair
MRREEIRRVTSLSCSVGIAPNKFLAKVASETNKPDGLTIIPSRDAATVAQSLPVGKVPGVGKKTVDRLEKLRVLTLGDLFTLRDFTRITRSMSFSEATDSTEALYERVLTLLEAVDLSDQFRLIGVAVSGFVAGQGPPTQLNLFVRENRRRQSWRDVEKAMDSITEKFGREAIKRGSLIDEE